MVPVAEVARQRERRRNAEKEVADLNARIAYLEGRASKEPQPEVDPEEAAERFMDDPYGNVNAAMDDREWRIVCRTTKAAAMRAYDDYGEMEQVFLAAVSRDPALGAALRNAEDPAEFAYRYGKNKTATEGFKSVEEMEAAWKKKYEAELQEKVRKEHADRIAGSQPKTQAGAPGHGGDTEPAQPPTSLAAILPTKEMVD